MIHRDLKPANVMLDGRGRVRITDFGLAVGSGESGEWAGTPAYMSPEQVAASPLSASSDLYSLGLVFYEVLTGKAIFDTNTLAARRKKNEPPVAPSKLVRDIDPRTERIILQCLEEDPHARPVSAQTVAAALPGGDPLASVIASGETPSPEMLAVAGDSGALSPRAALLLLVGFVIILCAMIPLWRYGSDSGLLPHQKTPEELRFRARDLLATLGYTSSPSDEHAWLQANDEYMVYQSVRQPSRSWFRNLSVAGFTPTNFCYRSSPQPLAPLNGGYLVNEDDPPFVVPGMISLCLSSDGTLRSFRALTLSQEQSGSPSLSNWTALLHAAGLDAAELTPKSITYVPNLPFDQRAEWDFNADRQPIHVTAASFHGKPVFFEVSGPWTGTLINNGSVLFDFTGPVSNLETILVNAFTIVLWVGGVLACSFFARRNIRMGRGDRNGAFHIFLLAFSLSLLLWFSWGHFVPDLSTQFRTFLRVCGEGLFFGSFGWLSYMALEPYVRRHWPHVLLSWARISSGKFRNPIVGRDILVGMFLGVLLGTLGLTDVCVPYFVNVYGVLPSDAHPEFFGDLRHLLGLFVYLLQIALLLTLGTLLLYYVIRMIVRNDRFALAITFVLCVVASLTPGNLYLDLPVTVVQIALLLFAFIRFGFITLLSAEFVLQITVYGLPLTLRPSDWYFARSLTVLSLIVALAIWAFRLSTKGKRLFSGLQLDD